MGKIKLDAVKKLAKKVFKRKRGEFKEVFLEVVVVCVKMSFCD